jgi:DHA2 family multidrug resistance protein-like MFS transporter
VNAGPTATRREWIGLAVLFLPCLLYSMDLTVLHLAVPKITEDLKPSSAQLLWIIDIYGFLVAGSLLTMGTLGDRIGRRRLLLIGAAAFGAASVLAAFSSSAEQLIASRALLGIAGATVAPSTLSLIRNMFLDDRQRTTAIAIWITAYSVGGAIGPVVGGLVLQFFWWGAVFLLAVPVMVLVLVLGPMLLPEYRDPKAGRPDLVSAALSLAAVLTVIFGLKQIAQDGFSILPALSILGGVALGVVFVRRQLTLADPLIDLRLFRMPDFSASVTTYALGCLVIFGGFLFIPQYLQLVLGLSPLEAGLWTVPWGVAFVVGSMLTPRLARRVKPAYVMAAGLVLAAVGLAVIALFDASTGLAVFVATTVAFALGLAPMFVLTNDLIIGSAPPERAGAASGISETGAELGGALGIAIFGSIGIAVYRRAIDGAIPPGIPPEAVEAAKGTLGGAIATAAQLPDQLGAPLLAAARIAFIDGLQVTAAISAVGSIALAIFVAVVIGRVRAGTAAEASSEREVALGATARQLEVADR